MRRDILTCGLTIWPRFWIGCSRANCDRPPSICESGARKFEWERSDRKILVIRQRRTINTTQHRTEDERISANSRLEQRKPGTVRNFVPLRPLRGEPIFSVVKRLNVRINMVGVKHFSKISPRQTWKSAIRRHWRVNTCYFLSISNLNHSRKKKNMHSIFRMIVHGSFSYVHGFIVGLILYDMMLNDIDKEFEMIDQNSSWSFVSLIFFTSSSSLIVRRESKISRKME